MVKAKRYPEELPEGPDLLHANGPGANHLGKPLQSGLDDGVPIPRRVMHQRDLLEDILQSAAADAAASGLSVTRVAHEDLYETDPHPGAGAHPREVQAWADRQRIRPGDRTLVEFVIPGEPMVSLRMKFGRGKVYPPAQNVLSKKHIVDHMVACWRELAIAEAPLELELHTYYGWPPSWSKKKRERVEGWGCWKITKPDLDNIVKIYKDAANAILWKDDCQIVSARITKRYSDHPRSHFILRRA